MLLHTLLFTLPTLSLSTATPPPVNPEHATSLLHSSMTFMDTHYDPSANYLFSLTSALLHETRSSAWYAAGLLARSTTPTTNSPSSDVEEAIKILSNIISAQFTNSSEQWYGDYQVYPEQPYQGTPWYPATIYNTWDPNWRGFIGTTFIVILEEFPHLLPSALQSRLLESLHLDAVGDTYRVGGVDGDNLYPCYSNAALMHAVLSSWVGAKTQDANLTAEGETWAREILELFDMDSTLAEFNSPTYLGVSLFALTVGAKYLPSNSTLGREAGRMIGETWELVGEMYNAGMGRGNLAGPWDRSYGYDMERYLSIMALWVWGLVGLEEAPVWEKVAAVAHVDDFEIGPLIAILIPYHRQFVSDAALKALTSFPGPHTVHRSAFSPPYDHVPRNITTYLSSKLTVCAESFDENVIGGPSINQAQFNPVVIQWLRPSGRTGFITLYPQVDALQAEVIGEGDTARLNLTYPRGNQTSTFIFHVDSNGLYGAKNVRSWDDVEGIQVTASSGTVDLVPSVSFCGMVGGTCDTINEFDFWNFTYSMPAASSEVPNIVLDIEVV